MGHEVFNTKRSEIGELLYRLKYRSERATVPVIVETLTEFIRAQNWEIDLVVAVPPSIMRTFQPVLILAEQIAETLGMPYCGGCVVKAHETPQLKNVYNFGERSKVLKDAFSVSKSAMVGKNALLFDDLYQSGATLEAVASTLVENAEVRDLYVLTMTRTRR